jgi:hypothetical protein
VYYPHTEGNAWLFFSANKIPILLYISQLETKPVTSVKTNLLLPDDGPYEIQNMECILEF